MNNVVRHSQARRAWVTLTSSDEAVELVVGDDGRGFDPRDRGARAAGPADHARTGRGGGRDAEIASATGRGTVVTATWSAERRVRR